MRVYHGAVYADLELCRQIHLSSAHQTGKGSVLCDKLMPPTAGMDMMLALDRICRHSQGLPTDFRITIDGTDG